MSTRSSTLCRADERGGRTAKIISAVMAHEKHLSFALSTLALVQKPTVAGFQNAVFEQGVLALFGGYR
jgi:hypothetical protein